MNPLVSRRTLLAAAAILSTTSAFAQNVAQVTQFSQAAFDAAQSSGKSILIEVSATWCPVCKVQKPIISSLKSKSAYSNVAVFEIDYDTQKDLLQKFGVTKQSTLIAFKGSKETSRSIGETKPEAIETLLKSSI